MAFWNEKPPMLTGNYRTDMANLREYLFRLVKHLEEGEYGTGAENVNITYDKDGRQILSPGSTGGENVDLRKDFQDLKSQVVQSLNALRQEIIDGDADVKDYVDGKVLWPVGCILATVDSSGPAADLGGVWTLLATGTIGTETVYYYQKTGNGA